MTSNDIYKLLATKPHNPHHLKRYVKFVFSCKYQPGEYVEKHHICPKAKDLFPEYSSFKKYPWNMVLLTARQHIIAHVLLWKCFSGSQIFALNCMIDHFNENTNLFLKERKVPKSIIIRYLAKLRIEKASITSEQHRLKSTYKDTLGKKYYLRKDDPLIKKLDLVGNNSGKKFSEESKHNLRNCNRKTAKVALYFLDSKIKIRYNAEPELYASLIDQGWLPFINEGDMAYIRHKQGEKCSKKLAGTTRYCYPDGTYYGRIKKDDPLIETLGLVLQKTQTSKDSCKTNAKKASDSLKGSNRYNNGIKEISSKEHPGEGWVLGRLPRSDDYSRNHAEATAKACKGSTTWNDGVRNYRVKPGELPSDNWVRGMVK